MLGVKGPLWPWSYGSWMYNYLCNQCLSPLMLWVRISIRARCTISLDKIWHWLATLRRFSHGPVSSTNKTGRHDITEILWKVALNTIKQTNICWVPPFLTNIVFPCPKLSDYRFTSFCSDNIKVINIYLKHYECIINIF